MFRKLDLERLLPAGYIREEEAELPEVSELDIMRHYTAFLNEIMVWIQVLSTWFLYDEI